MEMELVEEVNGQFVFAGIPGQRSKNRQARIGDVREFFAARTREEFAELARFWSATAVTASAPLASVPGSIRPTMLIEDPYSFGGRVFSYYAAALFDHTDPGGLRLEGADYQDGLLRNLLFNDALPLVACDFPSLADSRPDVARLLAAMCDTSRSLAEHGLKAGAWGLKRPGPGSSLMILDQPDHRREEAIRHRLLRQSPAARQVLWLKGNLMPTDSGYSELLKFAYGQFGLTGEYLEREYQAEFDAHIREVRVRERRLEGTVPGHYKGIAMIAQGLAALGRALDLDLPVDDVESFLCIQARASGNDSVRALGGQRRRSA